VVATGIIDCLDVFSFMVSSIKGKTVRNTSQYVSFCSGIHSIKHLYKTAVKSIHFLISSDKIEVYE